MSLAAGTKLGPYEIVAPLGAGGMGEVYRARDAKLGRDVALKILPDSVAHDPERIARFEREAKMLAALNHPHIAQIYGFEQSGATSALVMELVEGETLDARLQARATSAAVARGFSRAEGAGLPLDDALPIARQIAEALEYAHEHGVVHRDLKPANIKVTPDGTVKVLDFGLAKAIEQGSGSGDQGPGIGDKGSVDAMNSPTITTPAMTLRGVILGTAAYMSPEQAKGKPVDKRTDIWAFGCVLYEMLMGRRAFGGEDVTDTIISVVTKQPDWTALPATTPSRVRELLARCLKKDPRERLRDIGDARLEIEEAIARGPLDAGAGESAESPARVVAATRRQKLAWTLLGVALAAGGAAVVVVSGLWPRARTQDARPLRVSIVHTEGKDVGAPAISPDAARVAYGARRADGMRRLWVRDLASGEARALAGTDEAYFPFWSPDSRDVAFFAGRSLKRVPADGGPVQVVTENVNSRGGTWAADGTIVFSAGDLELFRVSAAGGATTAVTKPKSGDWSHYWPSFLPDGRRFLFTAKLWTRAAEASEQGIYLGSLDSPEIRRLLPDLSSAVYAPPGYLVFVRDGMLTAAPFDLATGRVTGPPTPIGGAVAVDNTYYLSAVSGAVDGTLATRPPPAIGLIGTLSGSFIAELHVVDRTGTGRRVANAQPFSYYMALHPDGRRLAASIVDPRTGTQDLWLVDLQSGDRTALTTTRGYAGSPVWSADGTRVAYAYQPPGQVDDVYLKDLRTGLVTPIIESPAVFEHPIAWSRDGAHLLVHTTNEKRESGLSSWSFESRTLTSFASNAVGEAAFSPDDRYVAFSSSESGRYEVAVTTFPERRQTWSLTTEGGRVLSWRADGREILVATGSGHIVAYPVSTADRGFKASR